MRWGWVLCPRLCRVLLLLWALGLLPLVDSREWRFLMGSTGELAPGRGYFDPLGWGH